MGSERLGAGQHRARAKARAKGRAGCRAGRVQGQGTEGRAGTSKSRFCNFLEERGRGRAFRAFRAKARLREGQGAGQAGRREGAGAGHRGQGRVARFHFEVFKA